MKLLNSGLKALLATVLILGTLPAQAQVTETVAKRHMIAAANPHATEAGLAMLRARGSAVDAAIATQMVLGLVEPESSGIGGGGQRRAEQKKNKAGDFHEPLSRMGHVRHVPANDK